MRPRRAATTGTWLAVLASCAHWMRSCAARGPKAAAATRALARSLGDPVPGVRWAACEALGSIGPAAESAVPRLISALDDDFLYVRLFAASALGNIGPRALSAREALKAAAGDPALRHEAEWALSRIAGGETGNPAAPQPSPAPSVALGWPTAPSDGFAGLVDGPYEQPARTTDTPISISAIRARAIRAGPLSHRMWSL